MLDQTVIIMCLVAIVISIAVGYKSHSNIGLLGIAFAFIIGSLFAGTPISTVIAYWPVKLLFVLFSMSLFFGYASQNGTFSALANRLIYLTKGVAWFSPIAIFLASFVVSGMGAGVLAGIVFVAPIGFEICSRAKFNPLLISVAVNVGALAGGGLPWTSGGPTNIGLIENAGFAVEEAKRLAYTFGFTGIFSCVVLYVIVYFLLKGYEALPIEIEKPKPLDAVQKKNLIVMGAVIVLSAGSIILDLIFDTRLTNWCASYFDIQFLCIVGAIVCMMMKLGDEKTIFEKSIPWNSIVLICGMSMLMSVATHAGISGIIGSWLSTNVPDWALPAAFCFVGGVLSFFVSALSVVYPLMLPMILGIVDSGSSVSALTLITGLILTACYTGMSPFSQNGSLILVSVKDEKLSQSLIYKQFTYSFVLLVISILWALIGGYGIFG